MDILTAVLTVICIIISAAQLTLFMLWRFGHRHDEEIAHDIGAGMTEADRKQLENLMSYSGGNDDDTI